MSSSLPRYFQCFIALLFVGAPELGAQEPEAPLDEPLVVGTRVLPPFVIQGTEDYEGIGIHLLEELAQRLGFEFELRPYDSVGALNDAVAAKEVALGIAGITVTSEREKRIDFTHPFHSSGLGIAVPVAGRQRWLQALGALISPAFVSALLALGAILLLAGLAVWLFEKGKNEQFSKGARGLGDGFWWSAVTMTTVGYGDKAPLTVGGRFVALIWMFASIILISSFTAAIASSLTVSNLGSRITGPDDLGHAKVATVTGSTSAAYLDARGIAKRTVPSMEEALALLEEEAVDAVVYDAPVLRYSVNQQYATTLDVLPATFERQDYAVALPEGSPLTERVNRTLLEIIETREWDETIERYLGRD